MGRRSNNGSYAVRYGSFRMDGRNERQASIVVRALSPTSQSARFNVNSRFLIKSREEYQVLQSLFCSKIVPF